MGAEPPSQGGRGLWASPSSSFVVGHGTEDFMTKRCVGRAETRERGDHPGAPPGASRSDAGVGAGVWGRSPHRKEKRCVGRAALLACGALGWSAHADAFCGFYVSGADAKLFNNATQ